MKTDMASFSRREVLTGSVAAAALAMVGCNSESTKGLSALQAHTDEETGVFNALVLWIVATNDNAGFAIPLDPGKVSAAIGVPIVPGGKLDTLIKHVNDNKPQFDEMRAKFTEFIYVGFSYGGGQCPKHPDTLSKLTAVKPNG